MRGTAATPACCQVRQMGVGQPACLKRMPVLCDPSFMEGSMPRFCFLLLFPLLPGCLAFGYPSATYTPQIPSLPPDVHAFKSTFSTSGMSIIMPGGKSISASIERIPIEDGRLDSLQHTYFAYFLGGFPVNFSEHHDWRLLLYRPGYEIIEIPSRWCGRKLFESQIDQLAWKPATDIDSQLATLKLLCPERGVTTPSAEVRQFVEQERERLTRLRNSSR